MKIYICNNAHTYIWGQHIPYNAWYGQDSKSWWFCTIHGRSDDGSLVLYRFNGTRWVKVHENSDSTRTIWVWAESNALWWTKVHWFKEEDKQKSLVTKRDNKFSEYANLMKHSRKHKKSGGIRLDKENFYANKLFTDYECRNIPMHDFRQYYQGEKTMTKAQKRRIKRMIKEVVYSMKLGIIILLPFVLMIAHWIAFGYQEDKNMERTTNKTINIKTYEQAAQYLLQMFSDGMLSFEDYSTQLDKLGNMYLKKVDSPNLITRMITTVTRNKGEEILVSFDDEVKVIDREEFRKQWFELEDEWLEMLGIN